MLIFIRYASRKNFMRNLVIALSVTGLLSACGLKGPLVMPGQKPAATAAPATPADDKKSPGSVAP